MQNPKQTFGEAFEDFEKDDWKVQNPNSVDKNLWLNSWAEPDRKLVDTLKQELQKIDKREHSLDR